MSQYRRIDPKTVPGIAARLKLLRIAMCGDETGAQAEFCRQTDVSPANWCMWENGRGGARIGLDSALKLVERWNVTLDWLYLGEDYGVSKETWAEIQKVGKRARKRA